MSPPTQSVARDFDAGERFDSPPVLDLPAALPQMEPEDRLLRLARALWTERTRVLRLALAGAAFALLVALLTPNSYRSTTRLMPPDNQAGSGLAAFAGLAGRMGGGDLGFLAGDVLGMQGSGALFVGVTRSRTAEDRLVERFDLRSVYGAPWLHQRARSEGARRQLEQNTEIAEDRKSGILTISVTDRDPQRAAALAQGYVEELDRLLASLGTSAAGRERQFLEQRLKDVKRDLDEAARALSEFSSKNATLDPKDQGRAMVEAAATLEGEMIAAQAQLRSLEAIYTGNNVRVRSLRARVAELKKQLAQMSGSAGAARETAGAAEEMPFPSMRQLPLLGVTYSDLYRRARIQETVYQVLTQQYELAKVQEAKEIPTVRVLDVANVPERKWGPHRALLVVLGALLGLLFGCAWVIGADQWRAADPRDPYKQFFSEVFATLRRSRWWAGSEQRMRRVVQFSRARFQRWTRPQPAGPQ